ncbi:DUF4372 domain-containing protein [Thermodesulfobacteriota bacterium]
MKLSIQGRTVLSQVLDFLPMHQFRQCVSRYGLSCC